MLENENKECRFTRFESMLYRTMATAGTKIPCSAKFSYILDPSKTLIDCESIQPLARDMLGKEVNIQESMFTYNNFQRTCVPKAFNRLPRSFSISARALAKFNAAFDNVLPLVHVFSTPYFLLSSDNLVPMQRNTHKESMNNKLLYMQLNVNNKN